MMRQPQPLQFQCPMTDTATRPTAAEATDRESWIAALEALTEEEGYVEPLGEAHWAFFTDLGTTLLVSFETRQSAMARPDRMPQGNALAVKRGWSHLAILAEGETWWRDPAVWAYFDRLVDDAFFEDFDRVLFYGAGAGGYAACAYSVTAPGAQVLALSPRATQSPALAGWDRRDMAARRKDFTSRYGYAPDMTEGAGQVAILFDPTVAEDAMHAALFRAPWVTLLPMRLMKDRLDWALHHTGILGEVLDLAMAGRLGGFTFAQLWRKRRSFGPYIEALLDRTEAQGRRGLTIMAARSITKRLKAPRVARRLEKLLRRSGEAEV